MFKVDIANKNLIKLEPTGFTALGLKERFDIQEWIEKAPSILGEELLVIGKEFVLSSGKRLDLLCIDKEAKLVIVELKRDDSGLSVEWQAIKYASYCSTLVADDLFKQYATYLTVSEHEAEKRIEEFIEVGLDDLNGSQRIILVSKEFNSEVISAVLWLRDFGVDIQCTRLAPFLDGKELFIKPETIIPLPEARDYIEKKETKQRVVAANKAEWTGYWFANVGEGQTRSWEDNVKFGYLGAGGKKVFADALYRLSVGDKLYAYVKGEGYVGFGEVTELAQPIREAKRQGKLLIDSGLSVPNAAQNLDDDALCEHVVGVQWIRTVPLAEAKTFSGVFANQNVTCKLRDEQTLRFLQENFGS